MPEPTYENAKKEVERLVAKFKQFADSGQLKRLGEEETKKTFITPLFRALGWDMENDHSLDEVINEEKVSKGRADYSFRINGIPKFFLEAKSITKGLDESKDAGQAIDYAWHRNTTWAVLTNFETLSVYNAEVKEKSISDARFISLNYNQFVEEFQKLWWLSKQGFQEELLDKNALTWGKKFKKTKVGDQLLTELTYHRELLSKNIVKNNSGKNLSQEEVDEAVQRIIDRLIFIRTTEDREIEPYSLRPLVREFQDKQRGHITKALNQLYLQYDKTYNSKLFTFKPDDLQQRHLCETLEIENEAIIKVIDGLYQSRDGLIHYDFSAIDADVLGNIYEQYLSHILKKTEKRAKVESKEAHRKEQGIYYTPTYIVDYIVRNTLGEMIKDKKPAEVDNLKVLDMACGSGSFLLKAFDVLDDYYRTHDKNYAQTKLDTESEADKITRKTKILKNNLYGVDLDPKAVEIAQLNLLLKAAETKHRLPDLRENIKCGNSLIDQSLAEDTRAFEWNKEFPDIVKEENGFDVIIGNPPYFNLQTVRDKSQTGYFEKNYESYRGKADILYFFIERSLNLLKPDGYIGLIVANYFLRSYYADKLRKIILKNSKIVKIIDFGSVKLFADANVDTCILILKKNKLPKGKYSYGVIFQENALAEFLIRNQKSSDIDCAKYKLLTGNQSDLNEQAWQFDKGKYVGTQPLQKICFIGKGAATGNDEIFVIEERKAHELELEKELLDNLVDDSTIECYNYSRSKNVLIKTVRGTDIAKYPRIKSYLELHKKELLERYAVKNEGLGWFEIVRYNNELFGVNVKEQIYAYYRATHNKFAFSNQRLVTLTTTFVLTSRPENKLSLKYILGILNSKLVQNFTEKNAKKMGNCYEYSSNFIGNIPIKIVDDKLQHPLIVLVEKMIQLQNRHTVMIVKGIDEKTRLEKEIAETNRKIDSLVYDLYGLTAEERRIVEEAVK